MMTSYICIQNYLLRTVHTSILYFMPESTKYNEDDDILTHLIQNLCLRTSQNTCLFTTVKSSQQNLGVRQGKLLSLVPGPFCKRDHQIKNLNFLQPLVLMHRLCIPLTLPLYALYWWRQPWLFLSCGT